MTVDVDSFESTSTTSLLDALPDAAALRSMDRDQLAALAAEIRSLIIEVVAGNGGHLGSNLGAVELTLALHRVFDSPRDRILFDTGHQAYAHKLLTGRRDRFETLRRPGGLSGYPSRSESEHDLIENSHASTALSYADGLAKAHRIAGREDRAVVAVVGDGALTGGMAWEALNNIGASDRSVILLLNDNGRSYAPTIGGLAAHLSRCREQGADVGVGAGGAVEPGALFRSLGLAYLGPLDGHDLFEVERALRRVRELGGPVVVHAVTRKGCGFEPAETDEEERYHAPGKFDPVTGQRTKAAGAPPTWTSVFGGELVRLGAQRPDLVALTAAMLGPTGLAAFERAYPERTFDVGIAEQHAVVSAAGLAMGGLRPVLAVYATFLNRAFDQVLMDAALHGLGITLVLDRAGITGDDGPSHHGMWDLSVLQVVPGLAVAAPRDATRLRELLREAIAMNGPNAVRFPKGPVPADIPAIGRLGGADVLRGDANAGADVLIVAVGPLAAEALGAAALLAERGIGATVVDPRWAKPLDPELAEAARRHRLTIVVEDGCRVGGIGDATARLLRDHGVDTPVRTFGLPSRFLEHGSRGGILAEAGLTARDIADEVSAFFVRRTEPRRHQPAEAAHAPIGEPAVELNSVELNSAEVPVEA